MAVANGFLQGYALNPNHGHAVIAIGTANANYDWECNNTGNISPLWFEAGEEWRNMVEELSYNTNKVTLAAGNDVESWLEFLPWVACGKGAIAWFNGYAAASVPDPNDFGYDGVIRVLNFGSNAWAENNLGWTEDQMYSVFMGRSFVEAHPQVYCDNDVYVYKWVELANTFISTGRPVVFSGITSDNANPFANICKNRTAPSLTWREAWFTFDSALSEIPGRRLLVQSATSYYLSSP